MRQATLGRELREALGELRGNDRDDGPSLEQQPDAPLGHGAAAHDEDGAILEIRE
jgi:hypothetical protein